MLFARLEKKGKYVNSWSGRDVAFDTEAGMLYVTGKETKIHVMWRHKMRVMRITAMASVVDINYGAPDFDARELFSFRLEGCTKPIETSFTSYFDQPTDGNAVVKPFPPDYKRDAADVGDGKVIVWYLRAKTHKNFMCVYTAICDFLVKEGLHPPQFWGLPKKDPRFALPFAEPPLYLWCAFRAVRHSVFYACVHGRMAIRGSDMSLPSASLTLSENPLYLTLFDSSVVVFDERKHVLAGTPVTEIKALHYATLDVDESLTDPNNERRWCFLALTTDNEKYSDILFAPALERFAEATEENVPAAQVNRVCAALPKLAPQTEVVDACKVAESPQRDVESAQNGLFDMYARRMWGQRPLRLPEAPAIGSEEELSVKLISTLPPPLRLSELASEFGIKMRETLTKYPHSSDYFFPEPTVHNQAHAKKRTNPLHDIFAFGHF